MGKEFGPRLGSVNNLQESGKGLKNLGSDCEQQNLVLLAIHASDNHACMIALQNMTIFDPPLDFGFLASLVKLNQCKW